MICAHKTGLAEVTHDGYERIAPGEYLAYCRTARLYRDPQFKRWTCLLRWEVFDESGLKVIGHIPQWISLGQPRSRDTNKAHASRRSAYWREWIRAKGTPPTRVDRLSPSVFARRMGRVLVRDTAGLAPYSVVDRILTYETGAPDESPSHPVTHQGWHSGNESKGKE